MKNKEVVGEFYQEIIWKICHENLHNNLCLFESGCDINICSFALKTKEDEPKHVIIFIIINSFGNKFIWSFFADKSKKW